MSFYDELGEQLRQAEHLLAAEEAQAQASPRASARANRRRRVPRPVLLGGLMAVLAAFVFVGLSTDRRTSVARAGLAIFETDAVATSGLDISQEEADLANARTAHPFETPNGKGYAFLAETSRGEVRVCVAIPDAAPGSEPLASTCKERAEAEAKGLAFGLVPDEPARAIEIVVLPIGIDTARFTPEDGGAPQTLPSVNGVVAFQPPSRGVISWATRDGSRESIEVVRNFPASKLEITCKDGTVIYRGGEDIRIARTFCRPFGGVRGDIMGVPTTDPETKARPENRSRFADGASSTTPTTP